MDMDTDFAQHARQRWLRSMPFRRTPQSVGWNLRDYTGHSGPDEHGYKLIMHIQRAGGKACIQVFADKTIER